MANLPRIASIKVKIERAKEHVDNLKSEIDDFFRGKPYVAVPQDEQQTGDRVFNVRIQREFPGDGPPSLATQFIISDPPSIISRGNLSKRMAESPVTARSSLSVYPVSRNFNPV